jgi:hypothetical protein
VLRAATAPNSPAIFFSMMSLQMPSAHPRVGRKREKAAICSMMGGTLQVASPDCARSSRRFLGGSFFVAAARRRRIYLRWFRIARDQRSAEPRGWFRNMAARPLTGAAVAARAAKRSISANALRPSSVMRHPAIDPDHHSLREDTNIRKARREAIGTFTPFATARREYRHVPLQIRYRGPSIRISPRSSAPLPESSPAASSIG